MLDKLTKSGSILRHIFEPILITTNARVMARKAQVPVTLRPYFLFEDWPAPVATQIHSKVVGDSIYLIQPAKG